MKMSNIKSMISSALVALAIVACSKDDNNSSYSGKNHVYITSQGTTTLSVGEEKQIEAKIGLSAAVNDATTIKLKAVDAKGNTSDLLTFTPNPVTIAKGAREVSFTIALSAAAQSIESEQQLKVTIESSGNLEPNTDLSVSVKPAAALAELTEAQKALVKAYQAKGMNILPFLGKVKVKTMVTLNSTEDLLVKYKNQFPKTYDGYTVITLSEKATADQPVLKMTSNPMGLTDFFQFLMRKETIENDDVWYGENAGPNYTTVMKLISWTKTSTETFGVTLDGIELNGNRINYVHELDKSAKDDADTKYKAVPFQFTYTAWDRLLKLAKAGDADALGIYQADGTSNPAYYLNVDDITKDEYQKGAWKAPTSSIDYTKKTMQFEFSTYAEGLDDYINVKVEYTAE
jgi:putative lipoprotein